MVDEPTEEDRLEFVRSYGVEPVTDVNTDLTFKDAALSVAEMTPIIGDAMAAKEVYDELMKEDPNYGLIAALGGAALVGAVPGIGDAAAAGIRKAADTLKRVEIDPDALGMMGGNIRLKPEEPKKMLSNVEYDARVAELDEALTADEWKRKAKALVEEGRVVDPQVRTPELEQSARDLIDNKITREEHLQKIDEFKPVDAWDDLPREPSDKATVFALNNKQQTDGNFVLSNTDELGVKKANLKIGDRFLGRLDIPAYKDFDTWIITGTTPKGDRGSTYAKAIHYEARDGKPVILRAAQAKGEEIGKGETGKIGYAVVDGNVKDLDVDAIRAKAAEYLNDPEWTQVGFDPRRQAGFYVRAGENKHVPVREATEVIQIGPLVLAKNAKLDFDHKGYSEGGMALEEQMSMNFGDVPDNTIGQDPVSGNEIPLGATAENVRDDIPANLSEGEIVVPADVVNFHGVKLFEDLRKEAKMGYAQMAEDGRIGGEPMDINDDMDIELSELDLEIMDDEAPVEMRRGGMSMKDYETPAAKKAFAQAAKRNPSRKNQKTHEEIMAQFRDNDSSSSSSSSKPTAFAQSLSKRVQARKDKPKTRGEALYQSLREYFDFDREYENRDRRVKLTQKPPTSDDIGPSIADQINFGGKGYDFRNDESPTPPPPPPPKVRQSTTGARGTPDDDETFSVRYADQPFYTRLLQNLKKDLGFDEGGLVPDEDQHLIGGESQFNQGPYYAPDQKGGFDMENAYANYGQGDGPVLEMREYMNDEGHRIFITFIDGEPQMEIPEGYYPVGDNVVVAPEVPPVGGSGGSDDGGSGMDMPTATPVNYKELSIEELQQMVEDHKSFGSKVFAALSPLTRLAMWDQTRRTRAEIERRLSDPTTSNVDRMRLEQLLDIANRDEPGLIKTLVDKVTGNTLQTAAGQIPKPKIPDVDFDDPTEAGTVAAPYTPNDQEEEPTTTPGVNEKSPAQIIQDSIDIKRIEDEMKSQPRPTSDDDDDDEPFVQPSYDTIPPVDSGFGGMGPDPAEQFGGSQTRFQPEKTTPTREEQMLVQGINKGARVTKKRKTKKSK